MGLHCESTRDSDEGQDKLLLAMNRHDWVRSWRWYSKGAVNAQAEVRWGARILLQNPAVVPGSQSCCGVSAAYRE